MIVRPCPDGILLHRHGSTINYTMYALPLPDVCGRLLLTMIVGLIAWRNANASECTMPSPTTLLAQARKQPQLREQLQYLPSAFPSQAHTVSTRDGGRTDQWLGLQWDGPPQGALLLLDCAGHILDASDVGAVETIEEGPTLSAAGQAVLMTAITNTGTGYKLEKVDLFGGEGGRIHLLWSHTKHESIFVLPNENGEDDVYTWRFEQAGTVIRVLGRRTTFPPPVKDVNGNAPRPLSVKSLPTERYCWSPPQARYEACNIVASIHTARLAVIPFVGCPSDGQNGPEAAPTGQHHSCYGKYGASITAYSAFIVVPHSRPQRRRSAPSA